MTRCRLISPRTESSPALALFVCLCVFLTTTLIPARAAAEFNAAKIADMDQAITNAIAEHKLPGGVLWLEREDRIYHKAFGHRALVPETEPMTEETIFDAASLTKVLATAPSIMLLLERGQLRLDDLVKEHLPEFRGEGTETMTLRHLLTHTSGLRSGLGGSPPWTGYEKAIRLACAEKPTDPPGTIFRYSDINYILLGEVAQRMSKRKLEAFDATEIYRRLQTTDTGYLPPWTQSAPTAPTERTKER